MAALNKLAKHLATGAVAGAVATWAMNKVTAALESRRHNEPTLDEALGEQTPVEEVVVDRAADTFDVQVSERTRQHAARRTKWALGIANGVATAWIRRRMGAHNSLVRGAVFGAMTFAVVDEVLKPTLGIHHGPQEMTWRTHLDGFAGHMAYGAVNAAVRMAASRIIPGY